jgi:hypothetical protein
MKRVVLLGLGTVLAIAGPVVVLRWWQTRGEALGVAGVALGSVLLGAGLGGRNRSAAGAAAGAGLYALTGLAWAIGAPLVSGVGADVIGRWLVQEPLGPLGWPSGVSVAVAGALFPPVRPPGTLVECVRSAAPALPPTPAPGEIGAGFSCAGVARLRMVAPASAAPGQPIEASVWIANLSDADLAPGLSIELRETWIDHEDRILARQEYPAVRIPPGQEVLQRVRVAVPADVGGGDHYLAARADLLLRAGRQYERLSAWKPIAIGQLP